MSFASATTVPPATTYVPSTGSLNSDLKGFASQTTNLANEILGAQGKEAYTGPTVIRYYHYYDTPWWSRCWSPVFFVPDYGYGYRGGYYRDRRNNDDNILIGIIAAAVVAVASFAVGSGISALQDSSRELRDARDQRKLFEGYAGQPLTQNDQSKVQQALYAAGLKERICQRVKSTALGDLILRVGILASSALALVGAIYSVPAWITAGVVSSLAIGCLMLFKWGLSSDKQNFRDAEELKRVAAGL